MVSNYKIKEHPLTSKQKSWLLTMCNHKYKYWWLSTVKEEEEQIRKILMKESYNDEERIFLNDIVDYYKQCITVNGTLNNPRE